MTSMLGDGSLAPRLPDRRLGAAMTSERGSERPSDSERGDAQAPVDPDVDLHVRSDRIEARARVWDVMVAVAIGGVLGAEARYGISIALPHPADAMPWATFLITSPGAP